MLFGFSISAQLKQVEAKDSKKNFYDIKKEFEDRWKGKETSEENEEDERDGGGYEIFKRWIHDMEPRVYPSGDLSSGGPKRSYEEFQKYLSSNPTAKQIINSTPSATFFASPKI